MPISSAEFRLLVAFLDHPRQVLDRDRLLDMVQGREAHLFDRAVDNQVSRLRRKIEVDSRNPQLIQTVWGGGYCFAADVRRIAPSADVMPRSAPQPARPDAAGGGGGAAGRRRAFGALLLYRAADERRESALVDALAFQLIAASAPAMSALQRGLPRRASFRRWHGCAGPRRTARRRSAPASSRPRSADRELAARSSGRAGLSPVTSCVVIRRPVDARSAACWHACRGRRAWAAA